LNLFQFDFDLTFAAFFLNAEKKIYARYGTRTSHDSAESDVSLKGLAETMKGVLELHREYPDSLPQFSGKQPPPFRVAIPEQLPSLKNFKSTLNYNNDVSRSCIHCHQLFDADRQDYRDQRKPLPQKLMYPYPSPSVVGLKMDTDSKATIQSVEKGSLAAAAGLQKGDQIQSINKQVICSTADIQWVLHHLADRNPLRIAFYRDGNLKATNISLVPGWRTQNDISWRTTSWDLRRMVGGGMVVETVSTERKKNLGLSLDKMALRVSRVGQYGRHAYAMKAGIRQGDLILKFDGRDDLHSETELFAYGMQKKKKDQLVEVQVLRDGKQKSFQYRLQ
jgi:serine protease Do